MDLDQWHHARPVVQNYDKKPNQTIPNVDAVNRELKPRQFDSRSYSRYSRNESDISNPYSHVNKPDISPYNSQISHPRSNLTNPNYYSNPNVNTAKSANQNILSKPHSNSPVVRTDPYPTAQNSPDVRTNPYSNTRNSPNVRPAEPINIENETNRNLHATVYPVQKPPTRYIDPTDFRNDPNSNISGSSNVGNPNYQKETSHNEYTSKFSNLQDPQANNQTPDRSNFEKTGTDIQKQAPINIQKPHSNNLSNTYNDNYSTSKQHSARKFLIIILYAFCVQITEFFMFGVCL